jgi:hypothetical protein
MVVDQSRMRPVAILVFAGIPVMASTASSGTGVPGDTGMNSRKFFISLINTGQCRTSSANKLLFPDPLPDSG